MKNNDLKQLLKTEANKIEINDYSEDILLKVNPNPKEVKKTRRSLWLKPSFFIPSFVALALIVIIFSVFGFNNPSKPTPGTEIKPNYTLTTAKTIIGKEILAGSTFISNKPALVKNNYRRALISNDSYLNEAKMIQNYLEIAEMMLNKDKIQIEVLENTDDAYKQYQVKMVVKYLDNSDDNYVFYYNETASVEESNNDDMDEINSQIEGIILINNISYKVKGAKEVENDEYETDLRIELSPNDYILVEQETAIDENEFSYTFVKNNQKVKELSQEFDLVSQKFSIEAKEYQQNQKVEYEMEFSFNSDGSVSTEYEKEIDNLEIELELIILRYPDYNEYHFKNDEQEVVIKLNK